MQRAHMHSNLLEQIVSMIYASPEPICFYEVKAHSGIAGNECADAIAKHSALHDGGHDMHFQPPAPDGNAYTHLYWLAANKDIDKNPSGRGAITPRLRALSDLKVKLKAEMCKSHRLGSANTNTGYYNYWKDLRPLVNKQTTNAFWNNNSLKFYKNRNVMRYRTSTIFNQKHGFSFNANCPICPVHTDGALHILSGCQHTKLRNMIIKRHNTASVLIVQALQKGPCGANQIAYTDVGSADKLSKQDLDLRNTANKTLPSWLLPKLTAHALQASSRPDAILFLPSTVCSSRVTTHNFKFQQLAKDKKLNLNQWEVHLIEFKLCEDTRPDPQLQKAQHACGQPKQTGI